MSNTHTHIYIYLDKREAPHCDVTGMMVSRGSYPKTGSSQADEFIHPSIQTDRQMSYGQNACDPGVLVPALKVKDSGMTITFLT